MNDEYMSYTDGILTRELITSMERGLLTALWHFARAKVAVAMTAAFDVNLTTGMGQANNYIPTIHHLFLRFSFHIFEVRSMLRCVSS